MPREYTQNLELIKPGRDNQYNIDDFNENFDKIDNFAKEVPLATKARELYVPRNINGVTFDGSKNIITGFGLWHSGEVYGKGNPAYKIVDNSLECYISLQDNNIGNEPSVSPEYWRKQDFGLPIATLDRLGGVIPDGNTIGVSLNGTISVMFQPIIDLINNISPIGRPIIELSDTLNENEIWLEGATVSRETYSNLFKIYGTTYGEGDGSTTFVLPDFRNRALWGGNSFGYLNAGLPNVLGTLTIADGCHFSGASGAFTTTTNRGNGRSGNWYNSGNCVGDFSAQRSNSIYGASSTVQPPAIKIRVKTRYK